MSVKQVLLVDPRGTLYQQRHQVVVGLNVEAFIIIFYRFSYCPRLPPSVEL